MLLAIREKAQGWFAWLIVGFITIPFALWGIQSYLGVNSEPVAAKVAGKDITQREVEKRLRQYRERLRTRMGKAYRPELFDDAVLRKQVLDQMIERTVLIETAKDWNMRIGDVYVREYIRSIPYFQNGGQFDIQAYNTAVRNQGMSQQAFEESVREDLLLDQLRAGITQSAIATDRELNESIRLRDQEREVAFLMIAGSKLAGDYTPDEKQIKAYYDEHSSAYVVPERVKVEYLELSPEILGAGIDVSEEDLRNYYQEHKDQFQVPEERKMRHILISVAENADQEKQDEAKAKAEEIYQRLQNGEDFSAVAKEVSEDPGSKDQGGDLGWVSPGVMVKPFEDAAFALEKDKISKPVRSPFGYHLIQVTDIKTGGDGDFEKLRTKIDTAYRRNKAEQLLFDKAEKLADLSYETPDSLAPAADALKLETKTSDWFDRKGGKGSLASPKVVSAAFSEDVLLEGNNSELIELDDDVLLVLRVLEHEVEHNQPLEAVKDRIIAAMKREKAAKLAEEAGLALLKSIRNGETTLQAAAQQDGWKLEAAQMVKRRNRVMPPAVTQKAFGLQRPQKDKAVYDGVSVGGGNYAVLAVSKVKDGDPSTLDEKARAQELEKLAKSKGNAQYKFMSSYLREHADVEVLNEGT